MEIFIKFSGDAKIGIYKRSQNTVEFYPRSGIAVLIDKSILPRLENEKVYSVSNPKFRILEKCVILEGKFDIVTDGEVHRYYKESIYVTHPVREVIVQHIVVLTDSVKIDSLGQVVEIPSLDYRSDKVVIKEEMDYEDSPLPIEYQWMLEKILAGKKIFEFGDIYLSQDENLEIMDARIVKPWFTRMAEYSLKTSLPVYEVSYRKHDEWEGQKLFHLDTVHFVWGKDAIFYPENGIVKIITSFQGDEPKKEDSIPTDEIRHIDDGEMPSGFAKAMMRMTREHSYSSSSRGGFSSQSSPKVIVNINRSGNVAVVEFWGRRYAVAFDGERIDHLATDDINEMDQMIHEREDRIKNETFELYRTRLIAVVKNEVSYWNFSENYFSGKYSESESFRSDFEINFLSHFSNSDEQTGLYKQLKSFGTEIVEKFQNASKIEELDEIKLSYLNYIKELGDKYDKGKNLISDLSNFFDEILKQTLVTFVSNEVHEIYEEIRALESIACDGDLEKLSQAILVLEQRVTKLPNLSISQKGIMEEKEVEVRKNLLQEAGKLGVPEYLLDIFSGNIQRAIQFMSNVVKIETWRLDSNELSCGRSRARATIENAWSAMGEITDFFCGADTNDVKHYVYEHHFGEEAMPVVRKEEKGGYNNNLSTSNDTMAEALRKAGLIS